MTHSINIILTSLSRLFRQSAAVMLAAVVLLPAAVSCSETAEEPETPPSFPTDKAEITAGIAITVSSGNLSRSAGTLGPDYDTGSGYENFIDIERGDFRFYFFDSENRYVAPFTIEVLIPQSENKSSKRYIASGKVERDMLERTDLKMVVLANWKNYPDEATLEPGVSTIDDICARQYDFTASMMQLSEENTIPLYGVTNILAPNFVNVSTADLGTIHLLRAFAKIEVNRHDGGFEIESVSLRRFNTKGFCAPTNIYLQDDYVHGNYEDDYANTPHIPDGAYTEASLPFVKVSDDVYVAYVPEFDNLTDVSRRSTIAIQFRATSEPDIVEFKYYDGASAGKHFDILRNYWYRFNVRKKGVIVQVIPYSEVVLNPIFGLDSNLELVEIEIDNIIYYYDRETGRYYDQNLRPIDNPYFTDEDPVTGWSIRRDDNNHIISYYDSKTGKSYAINKITEILDPLNNRDSENANLMRVAYAPDMHLFYYHDKAKSTLLASDKATEIQNPFDYYDKTDNMLRYVSADRSWTFGYYSINNSVWYAPDRTTAIISPFVGYDRNTMRVKYQSTDGSTVYGYYSTEDKKWYDSPTGNTEISNPF